MQNIKCISIRTNEGRLFLFPDEIIRLEASSNYTRIFLLNKTRLLTSRVLKQYEMTLSAHGFLRTHRSHLINTKYIQRVDKQGNIIMQDASVAGIARRKRVEVIRAIKAA